MRARSIYIVYRCICPHVRTCVRPHVRTSHVISSLPFILKEFPHLRQLNKHIVNEYEIKIEILVCTSAWQLLAKAYVRAHLYINFPGLITM